jgi:hypothetical protein
MTGMTDLGTVKCKLEKIKYVHVDKYNAVQLVWGDLMIYNVDKTDSYLLGEFLYQGAVWR